MSKLKFQILFTITLTKFNFAKTLIPALVLHNVDDTFHLLTFYSNIKLPHHTTTVLYYCVALLCCTTVLYYCVVLISCTTVYCVLCTVYYFFVLLHYILTLHTIAGYCYNYYFNILLLLLTKQESKQYYPKFGE